MMGLSSLEMVMLINQYKFPNRFSLTLEQVLLVLKVDDGPANDPYGGNVIPCP